MERQISLRLPEEVLDRLDGLASELGVGRSALVRRAILTYLEPEALEPDDRPIDRVRDLVGLAYGGPPDLGRRHREHLKDMLVDRR
ncbi:MAG TPA: ribbon-helix-helix protein, CopG family [Gemmatimonadota bacterium]|nr:ribbon-helix-helix protein, CopG family [Gemmatimonadota bacterium]